MRKVVQCCFRADVPDSALRLFPGAFVTKCVECGSEVVATKASRSLLDAGYDPVCELCVQTEISQGRPVEYGAWTDEQIKEFARAVLTPRGGRLD